MLGFGKLAFGSETFLVFDGDLVNAADVRRVAVYDLDREIAKVYYRNPEHSETFHDMLSDVDGAIVGLTPNTPEED